MAELQRGESAGVFSRVFGECGAAGFYWAGEWGRGGVWGGEAADNCERWIEVEKKLNINNCKSLWYHQKL